MKSLKTNVLLPCLVITGVFSNNVQASEFFNGHFSGEVGVNAGIMSVESNLNVENDQILDANSIDQKGDSDELNLLFPLGRVEYNFGREQLFAGVSQDDIASGNFVMAFGYKNAIFKDTVLSLSYIPKLSASEVWQDPYLTGSKRKVTDSESEGVRVQVMPMSGFGLSVDFGYSNNKVKNDEAGSQLAVEDRKLLRRSGNSRYFNIGYQGQLSASAFISPSVTYIEHHAEGDAMSFESYGASLGLVHLYDNHIFSFNIDYSVSDYNALNPRFDKTQANNSYSAFIAYEYASLFNIDYLSFVSFSAISQSDSNINFYDQTIIALSFGLKLKF
ncbi:hypothetical protein MACH09_11080 [Vibrio sp. MACH09]|uniref:DUF2860 family protein n=1 Tax=Vibrio sp. MACH09 TaxID=3025122 RepID=UPI0027915D01|nr:DUF2860 family protein [Vibrio sp. MACH09]GLO60600.1 hypothetical protein MACH09_11080 [Vibrio sp. MACH09]